MVGRSNGSFHPAQDFRLGLPRFHPSTHCTHPQEGLAGQPLHPHAGVQHRGEPRRVQQPQQRPHAREGVAHPHRVGLVA